MVLAALFSIVLLVGIDQAVKVWVHSTLTVGTPPIPFINIAGKDIISLTYHRNTGAAFSILSGKLPFLIIITSIFLLIGIYLIVSKRVKQPSLIISVSLMVAGGLGNLIDRIFRGYVIDYLEVRIFNFAIFNFADCCVVIGAILMIISVIFFDKSVSSGFKGKTNDPELEKHHVNNSEDIK